MPAKRKNRPKKVEFKSPSKGLADSLNANSTEQYTADDGTLWVQEVQIREKSKTTPKGRLDFIRKSVLGIIKETDSKDEEAPQSVDQELGGNQSRLQFTVKTREKPITYYQWLQKNIVLQRGAYNPNRLYLNYVNWTFNAHFFVLFLSFLVTFMLTMFIFGVLLKFAGDAQPKCITVGGEPFDTSPAKMADAFSLSWTTFTTVGYGMAYTATGTEEPDHKKCAWVIFLCTTESLIGLLYAGMCAAILFGRVTRVQSHAQVVFSDAVCVEYGEAAPVLKEAGGIIAENRIEEGSPPILHNCPTVKFQLVNYLANSPKGEIMDATLKVVATKSMGQNDTSTRFVKVELKEYEHPFFKRVWHGRHTLNESSQLLTPTARKRISDSGGYWPREWTQPDNLRRCLNFKELIVTLTGISNISASTVHAYKTYRYDDFLVGYEFAPLLYKTSSSSLSLLKVDMRLVNDVVVQHDLGSEQCLRETTQSNPDTSFTETESIRGAVSIYASTPKKKSVYNTE